MKKLITGMNIRSERSGEKPAFLKICQNGNTNTKPNNKSTANCEIEIPPMPITSSFIMLSCSRICPKAYREILRFKNKHHYLTSHNVWVKRCKTAQQFYVRWRRAAPERTWTICYVFFAMYCLRSLILSAILSACCGSMPMAGIV